MNRFVIEELYRRVLPTLLSAEDRIFMHDNAPTHTAIVLREASEDMQVKVVVWPPHSPDLNPIEVLWPLLKAKIYRLRPSWIHTNNDETKQILVETAQIARRQDPPACVSRSPRLKVLRRSDELHQRNCPSKLRVSTCLHS